MTCLFKADLKTVKIPVLKHLPLKTLYFRNSIVCDLEAKKSYPLVDNLVVVSTDSFQKPLLFVNYAAPFVSTYFNSSIEETAPFSYRLKTEQMEVSMVSQKKPLLVGGPGFITVASKQTYYYSLTRLRTEGTLTLHGKQIAVTGLSWMDHQWANTRYSRDRWTWFSLQLDNGDDIVCFEYADQTGQAWLASISMKDGKQLHSEDVHFEHSDAVWKSKKTGAAYPLSWRITIPSRGIDLTASAVCGEQEVVFSTINYWEGPMEIAGTVQGKRVTGKGFMELVGIPSKYGQLKAARSELESLVRTIKGYLPGYGAA